MNIEECISKLKRQITVGKCEKNIGIPVFISDLETLLTAYEKEKEKNSKAIGHIEACKTSLGNYILSPNETEYLLSILKEE